MILREENTYQKSTRSSNLKKMKNVGLYSFGMYLFFGLILGIIFPIPLYRLELIGIGVAFGVIEWYLLGIGYMWPKLRYKNVHMSIGFYFVISLGIFLPALGLSVLLVKHNQ